jgi:hypothetical protein
MSTNLRRLERLEMQYATAGCPTCHDWPALVIQTNDAEPDHPTTCPACGRQASHVVCIVSRNDGPR